MNIIKEIKYKDYIIRISEDKFVNQYVVGLFDPTQNKTLTTCTINSDSSIMSGPQMLIEVDGMKSNVEQVFSHEIKHLQEYVDRMTKNKMLFG